MLELPIVIDQDNGEEWLTLKCPHEFCGSRFCVLAIPENSPSCCPFCGKLIHKPTTAGLKDFIVPDWLWTWTH